MAPIDATEETLRQAGEAKACCRQLVKERLQQFLATGQRGIAEATIRRELLAILKSQGGGKTIAVYAPLPEEVNCWDWQGPLRDLGFALALPVVLSKSEMLFARFDARTALALDRYGIRTPVERDWVVPDIVLAPCLGFNQACYRLGHGKGYYDRALERLCREQRRPLLIGIAFACCEADFEGEAHDIALDMVLSENQTWQVS